MYKIKQFPEDFMVKEISTIKLEKEGRYCYFLLKKINYNTLRACRHIADALHIKLKDIGFAGNKDKNAITEQVISILHSSKEKVSALTLKDIELSFLGKGIIPVSLGDLAGNWFSITVRNLEALPNITSTENIPNLFGEQRFSTNNQIIGKNILKRKFNQACESIDDDNVRKHLEKNPNDYIGALRKVPLKLLRLYVHAYQSYLFNKSVMTYLNKRRKDIKFPIIGFGTEFSDKEIEEIYTTLMEKENIHLRDFIIRELPELSVEGDERDLFITVKNFMISEPLPDECNHGKKKVTVSFTLPKGNYATVVIEHLFSENT